MVERRLEQAAEEGEDGMLGGLRFLPVRWLIPLLSFPLCGNGLSKPLDSSLRWNDDWGWNVFFCHPDSLFDIPDKIADAAPTVIYGQDVLYAARGQEARSRPAKAGIQGAEPGF